MENIFAICCEIKNKIMTKNYDEIAKDIEKIINITKKSSPKLEKQRVPLKREIRRGKTTEFAKVALRARSFEFKYPPNISAIEVIKVLKKNFPFGKIDMKGEENDRSYIVTSDKSKSITSMGKYNIRKKTPIIRTFSYDISRALLRTPDSALVKKSFLSFFERPNTNDCMVIAGELKQDLANTKIMYHSEYIISCIVFNYLKEIGIESNWDKLKLFSLDAKMETYQLNMEMKPSAHPFRCDLVLFFATKLFIMEFKYRYDRSESQATRALKCIEDKDYTYKVLEFLNRDYKKIMEGVLSVVVIGIGYVIKNHVITCDMKFKTSATLNTKVKRDLKKKADIEEIRKEKDGKGEKEASVIEEEKEV